MTTYAYIIKGTDGDAKAFELKGEVDDHDIRSVTIGDVADAALRLSFEQLTSGRAVFGSPGVGCRGPYRIDSLLLERKDA